MFLRLPMSATFEIESPWKFSFFSSSSYPAVARERRRQRKYFGYAVFREQEKKNAGPSWNAGPSVKRRFANGRRERRASFRL